MEKRRSHGREGEGFSLAGFSPRHTSRRGKDRDAAGLPSGLYQAATGRPMMEELESSRCASLESKGERTKRLFIRAESESHPGQSVVFGENHKTEVKNESQEEHGKEGDREENAEEKGGYEEMEGFFKMTLMMEVLNRSMMAVESVIEPWNWTVNIQHVRRGKKRNLSI